MSNSEISLTKEKQMINSLTGIKVIALLLLFIHHSSMPKLPFELGSRMCELLFVISGFLVGYNKWAPRKTSFSDAALHSYLRNINLFERMNNYRAITGI